MICDLCAKPRESSDDINIDNTKVWELEDYDLSQTQIPIGSEQYEKPSTLIDLKMISGRSEIAGYTIKENLGIATELTSASGWTAASKGNSALHRAFYGFIRNASKMGGNAIVSVSISTFGAGGGITSVVGGDAVGVLITGTVVKVEPIL